MVDRSAATRRRVEMAEMVGAVRGELRGVYRDLDTLHRQVARVELIVSALDDRIDDYMHRTHRSAAG